MFGLFGKDKEEQEYVGEPYMSLFDRVYLPDYYKPYEEAIKDAQMGLVTMKQLSPTLNSGRPVSRTMCAIRKYMKASSRSTLYVIPQ